jgi:hypothetical protein
LFTPKIPFIADDDEERRKIGGRNDIEMRKAKETTIDLALYFGNIKVNVRDLEFRFHLDEEWLVLQFLNLKIRDILIQGFLYSPIIIIFME